MTQTMRQTVKVYQVVDNWSWVGINTYEDHGSDTYTLGIFASAELAEKFIRQYEQPISEDDRIVSDKYLGEGIQISRIIEIDVDDGFETSYHELSIVEHELIEKLE